MFDVINKLYTEPSLKWIPGTTVTEASAFAIMKVIGQNQKICHILSSIDKYTMYLPNDMMISLIAASLPKSKRAPFVRYIKAKVDPEEPFQFMYPYIKKHLKLSEKDFQHSKQFYITELQKNTKYWFDFYGVEERYYNQFNIDLTVIKEPPKKTGLRMFI